MDAWPNVPSETRAIRASAVADGGGVREGAGERAHDAAMISVPTARPRAMRMWICAVARRGISYRPKLPTVVATGSARRVPAGRP